MEVTLSGSWASIVVKLLVNSAGRLLPKISCTPVVTWIVWVSPGASGTDDTVKMAVAWETPTS